MSTASAGRFNSGCFFLLSLAILSLVSADTNDTTTEEFSALSNEIKPTDEIPMDTYFSVSTNSVDGNFSASTRAGVDFTNDVKAAIDNTSGVNRNSKGGLNTSVESESITTPGTSYRYNSVDVAQTTATDGEDDDQRSIRNQSNGNASWTAKANSSADHFLNNSIHHQEIINLQFIGNSVDDVNNASTENKTAEALKPTKETIMGVGVKTTVSVSLRVQDLKVKGANLTHSSARNSSCQSYLGNNGSEARNSVSGNSACYEDTENITVADNGTEVSKNLSSEPSAQKPTPEDSTEISRNTTDSNTTDVDTSSGSTENYPNRTETITNNNSTVQDLNKTEQDLTQSNTTEANLLHNSTDYVVTGESNGTTEEQRVRNSSLPGNSTTETYSNFSTQAPDTNNLTSEFLTTRVTTTSTSWPNTGTETENVTDAEQLTTTPEPLKKFAGEMKIVRGLDWSEELASRQSLEYNRVSKTIQSLMEDVFSSTALAGILKEVEVDGFSEGSVLVDYFLILVESDALDPDYLVHAVNSYFKSNNTWGLFIDPKFTNFEPTNTKTVEPTSAPRAEPPVPQWVVAVVVIAAASLVFIILFAAVTIYGRHYGRRSYNKRLNGSEIIFDKPDYQPGPRLSDAAYENLAADAVYDVEGSPEKIDGMTNSLDNQFDSWRTNRLTRMPSTKRFSFNSS